MKHIIDSRLLTNKVKVALVGCGGVGSSLYSGLAKLHTALIAIGHPEGLEVTAYDPDTVTEGNCGRQMFARQDIGVNKAVVLTHRLNQYFSTGWTAKPCRFPEANSVGYSTVPDIIISCVDTKASRRDIAAYCAKNRVRYWLDTGNSLSDGQIILGQPGFGKRLSKAEKAKQSQPILPTVTDLYPSILDASIPEDNNAPSCSLAEALESQDLFIGATIATFAAQLLWSLFRQGGLDHHGYFVNLKAGRVNPLAIDEEGWKRFIPKKSRVRKITAKKEKVGKPPKYVSSMLIM